MYSEKDDEDRAIDKYFYKIPQITDQLISRRALLKGIAAGLTIATMPKWLLDDTAMAAVTGTAPKPVVAGAGGRNDGILVVVQLQGGVDGLNTVIPYGSGAYYDKRGGLAIKQTDLLPVANGIGFHPSLVKLKARAAAGHVAVVQGVGYANPQLSHFQSMDHWMSGWATAHSNTSGWLGRYIDGMPASQLTAVVIGESVPMHLQGEKLMATSVPSDPGQIYGVPDPKNASDTRLYADVRNFFAATAGGNARAHELAVTGSRGMSLAPTIKSCFPVDVKDSGDFATQMQLIGRMINANLGTRVFGISLDGFDTHSGEDWMLKDRLTKFDNGVEALFASLSAAQKPRVTVMTFSEFGRRVEANGGGTDHGTAGPMFLIGDGVKGGFYGSIPSLTSLDSSGNLKPNITFHSVYATVLDKWLHADSGEILGKNLAPLPLFR